MATNKPQDDYQKQGVRIPRDLHESLHEAAAKSGRSYNSELIARLQSSFQRSADSGLVLDQAEQIWELRKIITVAHVEMAKAADALNKAGATTAGAELRAAMENTLPAARPVIDRVLEDAEREWRMRDQPATARRPAPKKAAK